MAAEKYLEAAKAVMRFINTRKVRGTRGIYWSLQDAAEGREIYYDPVCMYAGASGILCLLLALYDVTGEAAYLNEAKEAAEYISDRWENDRQLQRNFSPYAFSSGWSGVGFALTQLYLVTGETGYKALVSDIVDAAIRDAEPSPDGIGYRWSMYPGIVGDAGTILFLLYAAHQYDRSDWKRFAIEAGRIYLNKGVDRGGNKKSYLGVDPAYFHAGPDYVDPNYPMGTGGIGFLLQKLYEASEDKAFLKAAEGIPEYLESVAVRIHNQKYRLLLPHAIPDRPNLFYVGYCHGPAGTARYFYKLYEATGEEKYKDFIGYLLGGLHELGVPEQHSEGYWNCFNICCGTAGLLNLYLGLWAAFDSAQDYEMARRCAEHLMAHIICEQDGSPAELPGDDKWPSDLTAKWAFALDRIAPDVITTPIGAFDGAAGIALVLIQWYLAENGAFHVTRFLDDPFPRMKLSKERGWSNGKDISVD